MEIEGRHRRYQPISFSIVNGEMKKIPIVNNEERYRERKGEIQVIYHDGNILFDDDPYYRNPLKIVYSQE